ncbi:hypothetical protein B0T11DRAFT_60712 [Plectosphaerella cucumerina]|jgi:hypothetical protein|uniref:Uncharacterized protein n=1 Tax=Plectosphaerella cucumerina TaxID=40658 RepID=A0A8K0TJV3_9PEZI|nr:hypothetical protein B0T11DRAFT_60712 [Plectosphaerella cucumerina]
MSSRNVTALCTHNNPDYVQEPRTGENDAWSGCAVPSNDSLAPVVEACCEALGDDFQLTYQRWFQLVAETETNSIPCYSTCLTNVSSTFYADSQNITDCVQMRASSEDLQTASKAIHCAGPAMRTSAASNPLVGDALGWTVGFAALVTCLLRL